MLGQYVKIGHDCFFLCASGFIIILSFETTVFSEIRRTNLRACCMHIKNEGFINMGPWMLHI